MVLAQGDGIDLSTRVNLDSHLFCFIAWGQLQPGKEGNLAIRETFGIE